MPNSAPASLANRRNSQTDTQKNPADRVIEHLHSSEEADTHQDLDDGGDAGTKGTGSAG